MQYKNVSFREALEELAEMAGISLPKKREKRIFLPNNDYSGQASSESTGEATEVSRQTLYRALNWLAKIYHQALIELDEAALARDYLQQRKLSDEDIATFQLGYAPLDPHWLTGKVKGNPNQLRILELVGNLCHSEHRNSYYDRFRGRLLFPIRDEQGRTVAFGGRYLPGSNLKNDAKYLNSPETPLFSKQKLLYGYDLARPAMRKTHRALIMEGYTDCIAAHRFGFTEAVAVLGVAVSESHLRLLKNQVDKVILILDGDEVGQRRAADVLSMFVSKGVDMSVLVLPEGLDPNDFLETRGTEAFQTMLETETVEALEYAFRRETKGIDLNNDIIASSKALDRLLGIIAEAPVKGLSPDDPIRFRIEKTVQNLATRFRMPLEEIRKRLLEKRQRLQSRASYRENETLRSDEPVDEEQLKWQSPDWLPDALEREMLELWLVDPTTIYECWETIPEDRCRSPVTQQIYQVCNRLIEREKVPDFGRIMVAFDDPMMKRYLVRLDESARRKLLDQPIPLVGEGHATEESVEPAGVDELSELEQSLREERRDEQVLGPEIRKRLLQDILDGFDRRDAQRERIEELNRFREAVPEETDTMSRLLQVQEKLRKQQEERKRKLGL